MAEIRKFDPEAGNAIAQALRAAIGESVRPVQPGSTSVEADKPEPGAERRTKVISLSVTTTETE
jgi:hypothetical protein